VTEVRILLQSDYNLDYSHRRPRFSKPLQTNTATLPSSRSGHSHSQWPSGHCNLI
jgi:hypothetical protein